MADTGLTFILGLVLDRRSDAEYHILPVATASPRATGPARCQPVRASRHGGRHRSDLRSPARRVHVGPCARLPARNTTRDVATDRHHAPASLRRESQRLSDPGRQNIPPVQRWSRQICGQDRYGCDGKHIALLARQVRKLHRQTAPFGPNDGRRESIGRTRVANEQGTRKPLFSSAAPIEE